MSRPPLRRARSGEKLGFSAAAWNRVVDAANWVDAQRMLTGGERRRESTSGQLILVKNASGADRERFDVLVVDDVLVDPDDNETEFQSRVALKGVTPASDAAALFVVLAEPLADGKIGRAWVDGVCPAWIKGEGAFVDTRSGEAGWLMAGDGGAARVLWAAGGTGERWAVIRLGDPSADQWFARIGCARDDWMPFDRITVELHDEAGPSGETVEARAPGTDGTGKAGTSGIVLRISDYPLKWQFVPLECTPTCTTDSGDDGGGGDGGGDKTCTDCSPDPIYRWSGIAWELTNSCGCAFPVPPATDGTTSGETRCGTCGNGGGGGGGGGDTQYRVDGVFANGTCTGCAAVVPQTLTLHQEIPGGAYLSPTFGFCGGTCHWWMQVNCCFTAVIVLKIDRGSGDENLASGSTSAFQFTSPTTFSFGGALLPGFENACVWPDSVTTTPL